MLSGTGVWFPREIPVPLKAPIFDGDEGDEEGDCDGEDGDWGDLIHRLIINNGKISRFEDILFL
jgi:hypothetical protein